MRAKMASGLIVVIYVKLTPMSPYGRHLGMIDVLHVNRASSATAILNTAALPEITATAHTLTARHVRSAQSVKDRRIKRCAHLVNTRISQVKQSVTIVNLENTTSTSRKQCVTTAKKDFSAPKEAKA